LAAAVGVGLFFGILPIWGVQFVAALWVAHRLRLNKVVVGVAANISIPPMIPFIFFAALTLGHRLLAGDWMVFQKMSRADWWATAQAHLWEWFVGSSVLAVLVAGAGMMLTYGVARWCQRR